MAPRQLLTTHFFDQLTTFCKELSEMYPDDPDFALGFTTSTLMRTMNPNMVVKWYYINSCNFESEILTKNEKFFLDHSFLEFQGDLDFNLLVKLKQYVLTMGPESKEYVWVYIQNMYKLSKAIITMNK